MLSPPALLLTLKYEDVKIAKTGRGRQTTREWKLSRRRQNREAGLRLGQAGDKLSATPAEQATEGGSRVRGGRPVVGAGPPAVHAARVALPAGTVPLGHGRVADRVGADLRFVDVSDSRRARHPGQRWKLSVVKLKDADGPTIDNDFVADLTKAPWTPSPASTPPWSWKGRLEPRRRCCISASCRCPACT